MDEMWCRFRIGQAFPSGSPVARWITGLTLIGNDLVHTISALADEYSKPGEQLSPEGVYYFAVAAAQLREAVKFLKNGASSADVSAFISALPLEVQERWSLIYHSFEPWDGSFAKTVLVPLRNVLFHYPPATSSEWDGVLSRLADHESGIRAQGQQRLRDVRGIFADELRGEWVKQALGASDAEVKEAARRIIDVTTVLMWFAHESLATYLLGLPPGNLRVDE